PRLALSDIVKRLKGRTSRILQQEFPHLRKRYWGRHFWASGYGAWSTGNITDEMVQEYLEHHRNESKNDDDTFILD
ncbi:MAG TPA: IS200/IS605 family transposase, partial [Pyrinomonadaceae bacterium]|nr:IS200/IS605 family transposase [Pyrinomonadaceae bacterium]